MVAGAALAGGGVFELVEAGRFERELKTLRPASGYIPEPMVPEAVAKRNAMNNATTAGAALLGVGGAVALTGGALLIVCATQNSAQVTVAGNF